MISARLLPTQAGVPATAPSRRVDADDSGSTSASDEPESEDVAAAAAVKSAVES